MIGRSRIVLIGRGNAGRLEWIEDDKIFFERRGLRDQIAFCAPVRFVPFSPSPIIQDLIERIDVARRK